MSKQILKKIIDYKPFGGFCAYLRSLAPFKKDRNPAYFCHCGKYIGFRGFCCKKCHDEYYDSIGD